MRIEDIVNLEVPLISNEVLSSEYGANIYFLDGSVYPITATVKDLRNASNIFMHREAGIDHIVYYDITLGNSGRSHGILTNIEIENTGRNLLTVLFIPTGYKNLRDDLNRNGSIVIEKDFSRFISEGDIIKIVNSELRKRNIFWPEVKILPVSNSDNEGRAYGRLGEEILRQNSCVEKIFFPYGSGEIGIGIYNFFKEKFDNDVIPRMPTIVLNQIKDKKKIRGKNLTEDKTRTKYVTFEEKINKLAENEQVQIIEISEKERNREYHFLKEHEIRVEKTAALSFAGARKYGLNENDNVVIINSGEGRSYEKKLPNRLYESNLARVAASAILALSSLYGSNRLLEYRVRQIIEQEFAVRYVPVGIHNQAISPSVIDFLSEQRLAFVKGAAFENPYYNSKEHLEKIAKEGSEFKLTHQLFNYLF